MNSTAQILLAASILAQNQELDSQELLSHRQVLESAYHRLQAILRSPSTSPETAPTTSRVLRAPVTSTVPSASTSSLPTATAPLNSVSVPVSYIPRFPSDTSPGPERLPYQHGPNPPGPSVAGHQHKSDSPALSSSSDERHASPQIDHIKSTLRRLDKDERKILEITSKQVDLVVSGTAKPESEDPRIADFALRKEKGDPDARFRAGLSVLSLADEYTTWERLTEGRTRVDTLCEDLSSSSNSRIARYRDYVALRADHFQDNEKAQRAIEYGVKLRVFERLYSARLVEGEGSQNDAVRQNPGVLAILCFAVNSFRRLRYDRLPKFIEVFLSSKWRRHAEDRNFWMEACLNAFNVRVSEISQRRKRAREADEDIFEERKIRRRKSIDCHDLSVIQRKEHELARVPYPQPCDDDEALKTFIITPEFISALTRQVKHIMQDRYPPWHADFGDSSMPTNITEPGIFREQMYFIQNRQTLMKNLFPNGFRDTFPTLREVCA